MIVVLRANQANLPCGDIGTCNTAQGKTVAEDHCCDLAQEERTGSDVIPRLQDCIAEGGLQRKTLESEFQPF